MVHIGIRKEPKLSVRSGIKFRIRIRIRIWIQTLIGKTEPISNFLEIICSEFFDIFDISIFGYK